MTLKIGIRNILRTKTIFLSFLFFASCASSNVIIDEKGVNMERYKADLADCKKASEQVQTGKNVAKSAAAGALIAGGIYAILGGDVARGASSGAAQGAASGGLNSDHEKARVVKNCLKGRGYKVLN